MRSSNPVFSRRGFSRDTGYAGFNAPPQAGGPAANPYAGANPYAQGGNPYAQDATNPYAQGQQDVTQAPPQYTPQTRPMTMDDVVARTGMTLGTVIAGATVGWLFLTQNLGFAIGAGLVAMVLALVQSFKRKPSPALILAYAVLEGLFLGALSGFINDLPKMNGAPMQAVLGTMAVFVAMLVAYKTRIVRVTARFTRFVMIAAMGFVLLSLVNVLFMVFGGGEGLGFRSGGLGIVFGIVGVVLGALFLALDFKQVEDGIAYGAPREESWLAAFGLTLTLVWIYMEMLRLISILRGD
ncbi:Bax inhibitor-1/YccA family protein [Streptomyces sp. Je 1-4]|uniref:Bax inhibitor-1/YccA family protein n=1 Tax=Streptomyces TaxID=1883 RepID=UPI0021D8AEA9|nr:MULTISPECIES: Bax inhibitor-1/YccA family protein [unclassified Streptomyces]UYB42043.1 Bax inhibitor-1/YccA family protein [Streptomyces sp. Je 1-4]UZQ38321.1 Bax inhibitor-1/YccA family protein [Streptomyces sp. Je 1-4] [Streptomyces sp. Je 1-4 4N24]UZQ45738.1 Bax inhibitor-1/YccA family protein [Streptomyces sp. Je 1-4] [Streptomyces sp. Je 1-4 4N24_ara]